MLDDETQETLLLSDGASFELRAEAQLLTFGRSRPPLPAQRPAVAARRPRRRRSRRLRRYALLPAAPPKPQLRLVS